MSNQKNTASSGAFYDFDKVKQIPIASACTDMLGLSCEKRGGNLWCKARNESEPSTILHTDTNTFYDFGTNEHGDVIHFVSYVLGISQMDAVKRLADAFHIAPEDPRKGLDTNEVADWEYKKIGIAADRATKNFMFSMDSMTMERIAEISDKYAMPVSELRKKHKKIYEKILRQKALPYVKNLRNEYFLDVWAKYREICAFGNSTMFSSPSVTDNFREQIKELENAEKILARAVHGTDIHLDHSKGYDPIKDIDAMMKGEIKPALGNVSRAVMQAEAEKRKTNLRYKVVDYNKYIASDIDKYFHSAFFDSGRVVVGYLQSDYGKLKRTLNQMTAEDNSLDAHISSAKEKEEKNKSSGREPSYER